MTRVAVTSKSFARDPYLREEVLKRFPDTVFNDEQIRFDRDSLITFLEKADRAIIALETINEDVLLALPKLKVISKYGVGLDAIDIEAVRRHNIQLSWTPGVNKRSVTELVVAQIIAGLRHLYLSNSDIKNGVWQVRKSHQLSTRTVGILGLGHVGQDLVQLLSVFGCNIIATDIADREDFANKNNIKMMLLDDMLATSDIVSIHTPLDAITRNMINAEAIAKMKSGALLVNYARGGIVCQTAVREALDTGQLVGAIFDVFDQEPPVDMALIAHPRFVASGHIGGSSYEAIRAMGMAAIDGLDID